MVHIDEYTRRDTAMYCRTLIAAVAAEYADGRDAVLEKLPTLLPEQP